MKKFVFKDHKADMFIEAYGKTFAEALENAAEGLLETIADTKKLKTPKKVKIREGANSLEELATYLLNRLVSEGDARELMFRELKVLKFGRRGKKYSVQAVARGQAAAHALGRMYVKAVTHHEATVREGKHGWTIKILPDI